MAKPTMYDPVTDLFTVYSPTQKLTLDYPLHSLDISDWASRITEDGNIVAHSNTLENKDYSEMYRKMAEGHSENTIYKSSYKGGLMHENENFAFNYLIKNGIPKSSAAGIVGNLYYEDLGNPERTSKDSRGTTSYGIAQFNSEGEFKNLMDWAKKNNITGKPNFQQLLDFIVYVIKNRPNLLLLLSNNLTPTEASFIWGSQFERFAGDGRNGFKNRNDSHHIKRAKRAEEILKLYNI